MAPCLDGGTIGAAPCGKLAGGRSICSATPPAHTGSPKPAGMPPGLRSYSPQVVP